jgi:hypothetical protein
VRNGTINFVANVTLGGDVSDKIIAANTVTVFDGVVVFVDSSSPALVFTNHANYSGGGGNGSTTGSFEVDRDDSAARSSPRDSAISHFGSRRHSAVCDCRSCPGHSTCARSQRVTP